jgi:hypothetical protein
VVVVGVVAGTVVVGIVVAGEGGAVVVVMAAVVAAAVLVGARLPVVAVPPADPQAAASRHKALPAAQSGRRLLPDQVPGTGARLPLPRAFPAVFARGSRRFLNSPLAAYPSARMAGPHRLPPPSGAGA